MTAQRDLSIAMANAAILAQPAGDSAGAKEKSKHWKQYLDSLSWDTLEKSAEVTVDPLQAFKKAFGTIAKK